MRMMNLLLFFTMSVYTLCFVMLTACAILGDKWDIAYVFGVLGVVAAYMWSQIPLSGGDNKKGKGGSYA